MRTTRKTNFNRIFLFSTKISRTYNYIKQKFRNIPKKYNNIRRIASTRTHNAKHV